MNLQGKVPIVAGRSGPDPGCPRCGAIEETAGDVWALGWEPQIPFEQTLRDMLDYWRKKLDG